MDEKRLLYKSEDEDRLRCIAVIESRHKEKFDPPTWLKDAESAFKWLSTLERMLIIHWDIPEKLKDYKNQGSDYGFEKFTILLSLAVEKTWLRFIEIEYGNSSTSSDSEEDEDSNADDDKYQDPETIYAMCKEALDEMVEHEGDIMYNRIGPAFHHVLQATEAHALYLLGQIAESEAIAKNLQPVTEMSAQCQAGIEGIKAKFVMTLYRDIIKAMESTQKAMELDPHFAAWKYLTGKIIRRHRREFSTNITEEELGYFEKAVELERNPKYIVFLAQAYIEMAHFLKDTETRSSQEIDDMLRKAVDLYRECWSLKSDSAAISRRVGNGMMKLNKHMIDLTLAKEALLKAIELSPNDVTYHMLGKFYYVHEEDDEKALECFEKTSKIFGIGEIIRLKIIKYPNYDPHEYVKQWETVGVNKARPEVLYSDIAFYYLYFKINLIKATKYMWKILCEERNSFRLTEYHSYTFCINRPFNLVEVAVNEILLQKQKDDLLSLEKTEKMKLLEEFVNKVFAKHPDLRNPERKLNLQSVQRMHESSINFLRKRRYGHNCGQQKVPELSWRNESSGQTIEPSTQETSRRHSIEDTGFTTNQRIDTGTSENSSSSGMGSAFSMRNTQGINSRGHGSNRQPMRQRDGEHCGSSRGFVSRRSNTDRQQYNHFNNNRYDTTVTDWRSEIRSQKRDI